MFTEASTLHIQVSPEIDRPLEEAVVTTGGDRQLTVRFERKDVRVETGMHVLILRSINGAFTRQHAWVEAVLANGDQGAGWTIAGLQIRGAPIQAEKRACFRVSTAASQLTARIHEEEGCHLLDISAGGFAVVSGRHHAVGSSVDSTLHFEGRSYAGRATVQSVRIMGPDHIRYGLECTVDRRDPSLLGEGLRIMSAEIQRRQLRRRAQVRRAD